MPGLEGMFLIDSLSIVMLLLVGFVGLTVGVFSSRYLKGDRKYRAFFLNFSGLLVSAFIMVSADHLLIFLSGWCLSNLFLVILMLHKCEWSAARASSALACKVFSVGFTFITIAFFLLYVGTGETSIQLILKSQLDQNLLIISSLLLVLGAMSQSAIWPFHRWLLSSLNSPTPVSAIMHAGLINGGGFLLARFAPLLFEQPLLLTLIFVLGIVTAVLGTMWKLMQNDIKRMLACSTMGQMGFMIAQCGLGLFPAAVAHLCWHGLFKAYLFLASGVAGQEKRFDFNDVPRKSHLFLAILSGLSGAYAFAITSDKNIFTGDTNIFLIGLALIAGTQLSLSVLKSNFSIKIISAFLITFLLGLVYGISVYVIQMLLLPLNLSRPQPLNFIHLASLGVLLTAWLIMVFKSKLEHATCCSKWRLKFYVTMLNASQPHPSTVTTHHNHYHY